MQGEDSAQEQVARIESEMQLMLNRVTERVRTTHILHGADAEFTLGLAAYCLAVVADHAHGAYKQRLMESLESAKACWASLVLGRTDKEPSHVDRFRGEEIQPGREGTPGDLSRRAKP